MIIKKKKKKNNNYKEYGLDLLRPAVYEKCSEMNLCYDMVLYKYN